MAKPQSRREPQREARITNAILVDAYGPEEQALGWYYYLEDALQFPFTARCSARRIVSPLHVGDEVDVIGMPGEDECRSEMFVLIRWEKDGLAVPLSQLKPLTKTDPQTRQAVEDWHYWTRMGYQLV
jgi:hypothetical protein